MAVQRAATAGLSTRAACSHWRVTQPCTSELKQYWKVSSLGGNGRHTAKDIQLQISQPGLQTPDMLQSLAHRSALYSTAQTILEKLIPQWKWLTSSRNI